MGILVGNPLTDTATDNIGAVDFWWHHAMISDASLQGIKAYCDFTQVGPLKTASTNPTKPETNEELCDKFIDKYETLLQLSCSNVAA